MTSNGFMMRSSTNTNHPNPQQQRSRSPSQLSSSAPSSALAASSSPPISPIAKLLAAMDGGSGGPAAAIEQGDSEQLQHWYQLLAEVSFDELLEAVEQDRFSVEELHALCRAIHLLMHWEHAQAEELKDIVEKDATEMVEREQQWTTERDALRMELSTLRERITAGAGLDTVHEAFRAEIDALATENAQLKQQNRDKDRQLGEHRDRAEELESRLQAMERDRTLAMNNMREGGQAQLEDTVRQLNQRLSTRTEATQRGQEWEMRKLRQRNEQALVLSEQVRELAAQNDELHAEVDRLTKALEEGTALLRENTDKFREFEQQFADAQQQIGQLQSDNRELRTLLMERDSERANNVELSSREFADLLQAKETHIEQLRAQNQKQKMELDEIATRLEAAIQPVDTQKEQELERLRLELVAAIETARRMFGEVMGRNGEQLQEEQEEEADVEQMQQRMMAFEGGDGGGRKQQQQQQKQAHIIDQQKQQHSQHQRQQAAELRLRLVQMDAELERAERELNAERRNVRELEANLERKELEVARLIADCARYRKLAFGDADAEMRRIERQLEFRDEQIQQLNKQCSTLQFELDKQKEREEMVELDQKNRQEEMLPKKKKKKKTTVMIRAAVEKEEEAEEEMEAEKAELLLRKGKENEEKEHDDDEWRRRQQRGGGDIGKQGIGRHAEAVEEKAQRHRIETVEDDEMPEHQELVGMEKTEEAEVEMQKPEQKQQQQQQQRHRWTRTELLTEVSNAGLLHTEIARLIQELNEKEREFERLELLYAERGRHLLEAKQAEAHANHQLDALKEVLLFGDGGLLLLDADDEQKKTIMSATEEGNNNNVVDGLLVFDQIRMHERLEALELENMELRRLAETMAHDVERDERERRMAEGARRLVYLAIREAKLERRVQIGQRMRRAQAEELKRMRQRLGTLLSGEETRSHQLALQLETQLFELARVQNALLHSVPVHEYNRVAREHKRLLRDRFLPDAGYHSQTEEEEEENVRVDISKSGLLFGANSNGTNGNANNNIDNLRNKCRRLQEMNDVLVGQNEWLKKEAEKSQTELTELNAFLDDLEAETELKSMLANMERRFLQAIREHIEVVEEREALQRELQRMERTTSETRQEWLGERQALVHLIGRQHSALERLNRELVGQRVPISISQLEALADRLRQLRDKERDFAVREKQLIEGEEAFARRERAEAAEKKAMDTLLAGDLQLANAHIAIQSYQLTVLTLNAEVQQMRKNLEKAEKRAHEQLEELAELREALSTFQTVQAIDLKMLEQTIARTESQQQKEQATAVSAANDDGTTTTTTIGSAITNNYNRAREKEAEEKDARMEMKSAVEHIDGAHGNAAHTGCALMEMPKRMATKVIVLNNRNEWEEQLKQAREQARLCVDSYKEQLERKEAMLEEYRTLVEQLKAELLLQDAKIAAYPSMLGGVDNERNKSGPNERNRPMPTAPKSSHELLAQQTQAEQFERRIRRAENQVRLLEAENADLEMERAKLIEILRRKRAEKPKQQRDVQVQVGNTAEAKARNDESTFPSSDEENRKFEKTQQNGENSGKVEKVEEKQEEEEKQSTASVSDGRKSSDGSDSGTVDDIVQQQRQLRIGGGGDRRYLAANWDSVSDVNNNNNNQQLSSAGGTHSIPPRRSYANVNKPDDVETLVFRHRNETRRLRMRLIELERRNKELSEQYASLRERSRHAAHPKANEDQGGVASAAADALRRDKDRLQKANAALNKTLEALNVEMEKMQKRLRRVEAQSKAGAELWEERKRHEHAMGVMRKRVADADARERELREQMDRRERHIEQLSRDLHQQQAGRLLADGERMRSMLKQWREEKTQLEEERKALADKSVELIGRMETLAKENKMLQKILESLQQQNVKQPAALNGMDRKEKMPSKVDSQTQTEHAAARGEIVRREELSSMNEGRMAKNDSRIRSAPIITGGKHRTAVTRGQTTMPLPLDGARQIPIDEQQQQRQTKLEETTKKLKAEKLEWEQERRQLLDENVAMEKKFRRLELLQQETSEQLDALQHTHKQLLDDYNALIRLGKEMELRRSSQDEEETVGLALLRDKLKAREKEVAQQRRHILELERKVWHMEIQQQK